MRQSKKESKKITDEKKSGLSRMRPRIDHYTSEWRSNPNGTRRCTRTRDHLNRNRNTNTRPAGLIRLQELISVNQRGSLNRNFNLTLSNLVLFTLMHFINNFYVFLLFNRP